MKDEQTRPTPIIQDTRPVYAERVIAPQADKWTQPSYVPAPEPALQKKRSGQRRLVSFLGGTLGVALGIIAGIILLLFFFYRSDLIMPGVKTLGLNLGGLTTAEASKALYSAWGEQAVVLKAGAESIPVSAQTLGLSLDVPATVQMAHRQGRTLESLPAILQKTNAAVPPIWTLDPYAAFDGLQAIANQLNQPPTNAGLTFSNGRVEIIPAQPGLSLNVDATLNALAQNLNQVAQSGQFELIMTPLEPTLTDVSAVAEQANQLLSASLSIHAYDPVENQSFDWTLAPEIWGNWLEIQLDPAQPTTFNWALNRPKMEAFLTEQANLLGEGHYLNSAEAIASIERAIQSGQHQLEWRIYHRERRHTVQAGETLSSIGFDYGIPYPWIQQANGGIESLFAGQVITIPSPDELLPLKAVENKRIIISLSEQKLWAYENGAPKWEWSVSTGIESSPTAPGVFQVQSHQPDAYASQWDLWMPNFMGIYQPVPTSDFMNGFHGFPTRDGRNLLWTDDIGRPVTYGCILVSNDNIAQLYEWAEEGVVVEIKP